MTDTEIPAPALSSRRRRVRPLMAAVTVLVVIGVAATAWITLRELQVQRNVFAGILRQKLQATSNQFRYYLQPVGDGLTAMDGWWRAGLLDPGRPGDVENLLAPLFAPTLQIEAAYVIPPSGPLIRLVRDGDGWALRDALEGEADPRRSAWYERARAAASDAAAAWSDYRNLPGVGRRGLLVGRSTADGTVLALGIDKQDLDRFTATAPITENGILFRRFDDGQIAWLAPGSGGTLDTTDSSDLLVSDQPEHAVIGAALREWGRRDRTMGEAFSFRLERRTWWAAFYPSLPGTDPGELGLIAPADDLSRRLETVTGRVMVLFGVLLALATSAVVLLAFDYRRRYRRSARGRVTPPADGAAVADLIRGGESHAVEFKSTMRTNLHAGKPGKEIELAWLKTVVGFLNTDGGTLLVGVADDGSVVGTEADDFPSEDRFILHFDNLIQRHVGLQFARSIRAAFHTVDGKRVFAVTCDRSDEPAFLKKGDEEAFYIRVGASSRELPGSRILGYLEDRSA